jgi:hypothetical protein
MLRKSAGRHAQAVGSAKTIGQRVRATRARPVHEGAAAAVLPSSHQANFRLAARNPYMKSTKSPQSITM